MVKNPLKRGFSKATVSANISAEISAGRPKYQAVGMALASARKAFKARHPGKVFPQHLKPASARYPKGTSSRAKNPTRPSKKRALTRPSKATGLPPSKRLKARRAKPKVPGYFPNPRAKIWEIVQQIADEVPRVVAQTKSESTARQLAQLIADNSRQGVRIYVR